MKKGHLIKHIFVALWLFSGGATALAYAAMDEQAPELEISEWINGEGITLESLCGKVVIIEFFQLWCPGCNHSSILLMEKWGGDFYHQISAGELIHRLLQE